MSTKGKRDTETAIAQTLERDLRGRSQGRKMKKKWIEENMEKEGRGRVLYTTSIDRTSNEKWRTHEHRLSNEKKRGVGCQVGYTEPGHRQTKNQKLPREKSRW